MRLDVSSPTRTTNPFLRNPVLRQVKELPANNLRSMSSDLFIWAAGASVALSLGLRLAGRRDDALFVGEWVPSMLLLGVLTRVA